MTDLLNYTFKDLFAQLGLPNSEPAIEQFIKQRAAFSFSDFGHDPNWTPAQREFLHTALEEDANWARLIDQLSKRLYNKNKS